jgi:hypothetical protein
MQLDEIHSNEMQIAAATPGRSLVTASQPAAKPQPARRQANFLAQLIATKDQHPQTRLRRRAEPGEAIFAYRAASATAKKA